MVTINIQKKDLYLIAAVAIFLVGSGIVIAYGGTSPSVMGHSYGEVGIPTCTNGQVLTWSGSAWACGTQTTLPTCTAGQVLKWSGSAWACGTDLNTAGGCALCLNMCGGSFPVERGNILPAAGNNLGTIYAYNAGCILPYQGFPSATITSWAGMLLCCSS